MGNQGDSTIMLTQQSDQASSLMVIATAGLLLHARITNP